MKTGLSIAVLAVVLSAGGTRSLADTTVTNGILSVSPAIATQGVSGLTVTFNLSSSAIPPVPPFPGPSPTSAAIGAYAGSSLTRPSQYVVTATFSISLGGATGLCDVAVAFPGPGNTILTYNKLQAFQVIANSNVLAGFSGSPTYGLPPLTVTFTNTSSGMITNRLWTFGDGATSTNLNPTHTYTGIGSYTVTLAVFGTAASNTVVSSNYVTVSTNLGVYAIVDTAQTSCYNTNSVIAAPSAGQPYDGQDAQIYGNQPGYTRSGDSRTVHDNNTGLTWMRGPNLTLTPPLRSEKKTLGDAQAWVATVNATNYGGFSDWRLPSIKELYSLFDCRGTDPSSYMGTDLSVLTPFIDTNYFLFAYGQTNLGERVIDSQYASSTTFILNPSENGYQKDFGVNFADGRIKGYDLGMPGGSEKTFFVQLVRGPAGYGFNILTNNGDGTVTDLGTGLMWTRADNGAAVLWSNALAWVQARNAANHLGHSDWRLPNIKELQSLINYANAPDYNGLPAIDTNCFTCTAITNEGGQLDYPYYWSGTTHAGYSTVNAGGGEADYIPFGRALGYSTNLARWVDVHGAGAQRSDPKAAPPYPYATTYQVTTNGKTYTGYSFGPQGDAIRGTNFVRLVRGGNSTGVDHIGDGISDWWRRQYFGGAGITTNSQSCATADSDNDGFTNLQEYLADTNPLNATSRLAMVSILASSNNIQLTWTGGSNAWQYLESSTNLAAGQWSDILTNIPPTSMTNAVLWTGAASSNQFFRIRAWR